MELKENLRKMFLVLSVYFALLLPSLAQVELPPPGDIINTITEIISRFISVIFIAVFILILLALGGVIKRPKRVGARRPIGFTILFIGLIIVLFILPLYMIYPQNLEVPASFKQVSLPDEASQFLKMLGLPDEWMYLPAIIYLFILPFAAIYTLVWAFLQTIGIFNTLPNQSQISRILAFIIAFLTIPVGWFVKIVWALFAFMGGFSVIIFAATFVLGIFFRGFGVTLKEYTLAVSRAASLYEELSIKIHELKDRAESLPPSEINRRMKELVDKYGEMVPDLWDLYNKVLGRNTVKDKAEAIKNFVEEKIEKGKEKAK
jgi:hypothetical protein